MNVEEVDQLSEKENANTLNKPEENGAQEVCLPPKRYSTRSSVSRIVSTESTQIQRRERSAPRPKTIPQFIDYKGKVEYFTDFIDIAFASDNLL